MPQPLERRFHTAYRQADSDEPGLIQEDDGTVWLVNPDGTRSRLRGGSPIGFAAHTQNETIQPGNGAAWLPDTVDYISDEWSYEAGEFTLVAGAGALYRLEAQLILHIESGGPADEATGEIAIGGTAWNVDPLVFDLVPATFSQSANTWRGGVSATLPISGDSDIELDVQWHPFGGLVGHVYAQTFMRAFLVGEHPSFA